MRPERGVTGAGVELHGDWDLGREGFLVWPFSDLATTPPEERPDPRRTLTLDGFGRTG
jgi:hypothetical protein